MTTVAENNSRGPLLPGSDARKSSAIPGSDKSRLYSSSNSSNIKNDTESNNSGTLSNGGKGGRVLYLRQGKKVFPTGTESSKADSKEQSSSQEGEGVTSTESPTSAYRTPPAPIDFLKASDYAPDISDAKSDTQCSESSGEFTHYSAANTVGQAETSTHLFAPSNASGTSHGNHHVDPSLDSSYYRSPTAYTQESFPSSVYNGANTLNEPNYYAGTPCYRPGNTPPGSTCGIPAFYTSPTSVAGSRVTRPPSRQLSGYAPSSQYGSAVERRDSNNLWDVSSEPEMTKSPTKSAISPVDQSEALPDRSTGSLSGGAPQNTPLGASKVSPGDSPKSLRGHPHGANGHPFTSNVHNYPSGLNHFSIHQAPANSICNSNQNFCGVDHGPQYRDPGYGRYHDAPSRQPYYPPPVNSYNPAYDPLCQYSDYSAVPSRVALVSTLAYLEAMCNDILYDAEQCRFKHERSGAQADGASPAECEHHVVIGLDLEGRDLGRNGSICVITLATEDCVYLIDIVTLGGDALSRESPLTAVLESPYVCKLMYDCRADCGALFYLYNVKLNNVCDLQAASCYNSSNSTYLPSMKDTFRRLGFFTEDELHIKERGRAFFDVRLGGSPDQWYVRPLPPLLVQYCAVDVKYFFLAREKLWNHVTASYAVGEKRINAVCAGDFSSTDNQNALRDFEL